MERGYGYNLRSGERNKNEKNDHMLNPAIAASNHHALSIATLKGHLGSVLCPDPQIFSLVNTIHVLLKLTQKILQIDHMLCHKASLKKFKKIEIRSSIFLTTME